MRWLICLSLITILSGCLQNISLDGLGSTATSTTAAVIGTAVGGPTAGVIAGVSAGAVTDAVISSAVTNPENFKGDDGELSFTELIAYMWYNFTQHLIVIGIIAGVLWILTGYLGARMKRPEEKHAEKQLSMLVDKIGKMRE